MNVRTYICPHSIEGGPIWIVNDKPVDFACMQCAEIGIITTVLEFDDMKSTMIFMTAYNQARNKYVGNRSRDYEQILEPQED